MNSPLPPGTRLGRYETLSQIGEGGMGEVYLAEDTKLDRKVALKILPADVAADQMRMRRFIQEAKAASALNHPNILTIYEIGQTDSTHFIATEYIEGETLRHHLASAMRLNEVLDICVQVAGALAAAHKAGIIHRDVKPENIMLRRDGIVKVLDFGLAKLSEKADMETVDAEAATKALVQTEPGVVLGTAAYMSPEQARGLVVDARTDIFSLGVVIYEMVAGRAPFGGASRSDLIVALLEREPPPLARFTTEAPAELERLVMKTLAKDREERYQTAKDLLIDLKGLKQKLVVDAAIERSAPPELPAEGGEAKPTDGRVVSTAPGAAAQTAVDGIRATSSAEYIVSEIKRRKKSAGLTLAALAIVAAAAVFFYFHRATALTEKDTILIADFVNTTGDEVFDGALKQALAVQLEQSPFLNIFPDERIQQTLRLMGRSPDVRVTRDVAREICERQGLKAMLVGSIRPLGSHYVIGLEAVNAHTNEVLAREQVEAENKEQVLDVLRKSATSLREKLGESLSTIQKFDASPENTTSSLEALKNKSAATKLMLSKPFEAISLLKRAVELDPQFASAYTVLAQISQTIGQREAARAYATKGFELRERASEPEKLWIIAQYYLLVSGDLEKAIETQELLKQTYPRHRSVRNLLANTYSFVGQHEKAVEELQEAVRLDPNDPLFYRNLARQLRCLGRFQEAKSVLERASAQKLDTPWLHLERYVNAFLQGGAGEMQSQMEWFRARPDEPSSFGLQTAVAEVAGQYRKAREFREQWVELSKRRKNKEAAAGNAAGDAQTDALSGHCELVRQETDRSLAIARTPSALRTVAVALALCGELGQAQSLADEYARLMPTDTLANGVDLPVIRAAVANHRRNYAEAIELLKTARRYDHAEAFKLPLDLDQFAPYLRGQAFLGQRSGAEAAAEFQYLLDHRGLAPFSLLGPLAQLGLARAAVLTGDTAKARQAYQDFFALWKDADPDLPILIEATKEYEKVR